jgi:hypothetical protein
VLTYMSVSYDQGNNAHSAISEITNLKKYHPTVSVMWPPYHPHGMISVIMDTIVTYLYAFICDGTSIGATFS